MSDHTHDIIDDLLSGLQCPHRTTGVPFGFEETCERCGAIFNIQKERWEDLPFVADIYAAARKRREEQR